MSLSLLTNCHNRIGASHKQVDLENCSISPHGLNNIKVGVSTIDDVLNEFGDNEIQRRWKKGIELELIGHFEYYLNYEKFGIVFKGEKNKGDRVVTYIKVNSNSKCQTKTGVGIGSSYEDIKIEFGQPLHHTKTKDRTYEPSLWYEEENGKKFIKVIYKDLWIKLNERDTTKSKIQEIEIF